MRQPRERRDDEPAFVLHTYPYRETSVIVEALTAAYGCAASAIRAARGAPGFSAALAVVVGGGRAQDACEGRLARRTAAGRRLSPLVRVLFERALAQAPPAGGSAPAAISRLRSG